MSSSDRNTNLSVRDTDAAQRSGQYPNSNHSGGNRFNVPAVARGLNFLNDGFASYPLRRSLTSSRHVPINTKPSENPPAEFTGSENTAVTSEDNGNMTDITVSTAPTSGHDQRVEVAASDGGCVSGGQTHGLSTPYSSHGPEDNDAESISTPILPSRPIVPKFASKAKKRKHRAAVEPEEAESGNATPYSSPDPEDNDAESFSTPILPSRPIVPKFARKPRQRKRRAAVEPEEAESGSATPQAAVSFIGTPKEPTSKGSARVLKSVRFATKEYKASQALRPSKPLFKPDQSRNVVTIAEAKTRKQDGHEIPDILPILNDLISANQRKYFDTFEVSETFDGRSNAESETKAPGDQEEDDEELPGQQETALNQGSELVPYIGLNTNLKPLSDINEIFVDLTKNALKQEFGEFLQANGSNKLKVATLCSGTESPLLAMQMISDSLKKLSALPLNIDHVFSCEIEPFKQAYIQRNFKPSILFRDVLELKLEEAHTAFGSKALVPNGIDIVIAGSSCIDFSALNNKRKRFGESGESDDTLRATIEFASIHQPTMLILENVLGFPWGNVEALWHKIGYATQVACLDSKDFYIPQTRQRTYMIAIRRETITDRRVELDPDTAIQLWFEVLEKLQRRASSPFTDFIFADDDELLGMYNNKTVITPSAAHRASWERCKAECLSYRSSNYLGFKKPITDWENNGSCHVPDSYDAPWHKLQVERVWETTDINHLRSIVFRGYDMAYKGRCIDLSQSCIRETDLRAWGCLGCITPHSNHYLTYRGGPLTGAEALALQGIPRERLILNRETNKQLVDLTGNAMTSTAVGAAILAALISCGKVFTTRRRRLIEPPESPPESLEDMVNLGYDARWQLTKTDLTRDLRRPITVGEIQNLAYESLRLCSCKSPRRNSAEAFQQCAKCGHTSCIDCGIKPTHEYVKLPPGVLGNRTSAVVFEERLREALPPRIAIHGLAAAHIAAASLSHEVLGKNFTEAIEAAGAQECQLHSFKCDRVWSVIYESCSSRLVLVFQRKWDGHVLCSGKSDDVASSVVVQWRLYAKPRAELPANDRVRQVLSHPIARLTCSESLFDGQWEIREAAPRSFRLEVVGRGEKVPSWEKKQGLEHPVFKDRYVWSSLEFRMPATSAQSAPTGVDQLLGKYDLLPDCGTACGSLHVKQKSSATETEEPIFLFLDPVPFANISYDPFVFANQHHKLRLNEVRETLAKVDTCWRPSATDKATEVACEIPSRWIPVDDVNLKEYAADDLQNVRLAPAETMVLTKSTDCAKGNVPIVWCEFPMTPQTRMELDVKHQKHFELTKDRLTLKALGWLLETTGHALKFTGWQMLPLTDHLVNHCKVCAPKPPSVLWKAVQSNGRQQIRPFEDTGEASNYERALKAAPDAVTVDLAYDVNTARAFLRVDFNILPLAHKAVAALSESRGMDVKPDAVEWRAVTDYGREDPIRFPHLQLRNCQDHQEASQPPPFVVRGQKLNGAQLKSLHWMIGREGDGIPGDDSHMWHEQEIVEARAFPMNLRLEAKAISRRESKGGVLADEVGYGKTALILALIDHHFRSTNHSSPPLFRPSVDELIPLKATLILVPKNLDKQWSAEIAKFLGNIYKVIVLNKRNFKRTCTVSSLQQADIILAPWDLFDDEYFAELARMSRAPNTPVSAGRGFEEWFHLAQADLKTLVKNSHGLEPALLRPAWEALETKQYNKFVTLSKRNRKGAKKPAEADGEPHSKRARTEALDVDDIEIEAPTYPFLPLHGCTFSRIVVDEFTYVGTKQLPAIMALRASRRWILSGTPPHNTFQGVNTMAQLLGTTIGVPDDAELRYRKVGSGEISGGEAFRSYTTTHSPAWHKERGNRAAAFVDMFVRQNTAFVQGIVQHDHFEKIELSAPERAAYHECQLVLVNQGVKMGKKMTQDKRGPQTDSTRTERVVEHIIASESPEDALLAVCSTMPEFVAVSPSGSAFSSTVKEKESLISQKVKDILSELQGAFWIISHFHNKTQDNADLHNYLCAVQQTRFGDATVCGLLDLVIARAEDTQCWTVAKLIKNKEPAKNASADKRRQYALRSDPDNDPELLSKESRAEEMKLRSDSLTAWTVALTDLIRERRFFVGAERCQSGAQIECSSCGDRSNDYSKMILMGRCGHVGCKPCYFSPKGRGGLSDHCIDTRCDSRTLESSIVMASDLTIAISEDLVRDHGSKMVAIAKFLQQIPGGEKAVVFVQSERIITGLKKVLEACGIEYADTINSPRVSAEVERFKGTPTCNVCVLQLDSANAAGWNLQVANHVVFVSSLVADNQHEYSSVMTQAIGRVLRMGQTKDVHVHHFLAEKTVDVNIVEDRTGQVLVDRGGLCLLVAESSVLPTDKRGFAGWR